MSLKCGIVGLPNVGKSTLFNALTKAGIAAENYPFCTIEPNVGIVEVPDPRLAALAAIAKPREVMPAIVEFVDIAGLVAGASKGEGLGNQFLANIRETDAIAHVVRCFEDDNVVHVAGKVDPISDIETINTELALADLPPSRSRSPRSRSPRARRRQGSAAHRRRAREGRGGARTQARPARTADLYPEEMEVLRAVLPAHDEADDVRRQRRRARLRRQSAARGASRRTRRRKARRWSSVCASMEAEIADLDGEDKRVFLADMGMTEPGLDRVIHAGYELLGLQTYFTAGRRKCARGRSTTATPRRRPPASSTPISRRASSAPRSSPTTTSSPARASTARRRRARCASKARSTSCKDGDVMHFRFNV